MCPLAAMLALTAKALYTPLETIDQACVLVEDSSIVRLGTMAEIELPAKAKVVHFEDCVLAPGLVDIHIHGSVGHDVMQADAGGRRKMEEFLARHGVTSYYPTTVTAPEEITLAALDRLADAIEASGDGQAGRAQPLGIHLEGPFLSHARRGVHPPENLAPPTLKTFEKFWEAARGHVSLMTIAPELDGAPQLIVQASRRGVCASLGHSDADLASARKGVAAGARHATHTFNAMRPLDHRDPGILAEVLTNEHLTADIIADGIHVDPAVVRLFCKAKGDDRAVLITDATAAAGMPDGVHRLGSLEVEVREGKCLYQGNLAGSVLTLDRAVRNTMQFAGWDLQRALRAASLNPARVTGVAKGVLKAGGDADLVAVNLKAEVRATMVKGVLIQ
ncbi:MAG TPA: N-acetylglucosamine-6-phosphate deacetylase [Terriglobales bacterium]|nr:N-acetylglucosamine-6-phosphate deacetylase [Terriglobales bacterium]